MVSNSDVVVFQGVDVWQEQKKVLAGVNFEIPKGDFVYLIGKTGGGKSTLLKTIYADLAAKQGIVEVAGVSLSPLKRDKVPSLRRKLGIIFQDFQLFYDRNVAENLFFVMQATGWTSRSAMKRRLSEVLMKVGLQNIENKMPHQLSGGEQQRVVIARSLINEPMLLVADEPTGNLDPEVSRSILKLFEEINRSGTAIIMATHNHELVKQFPHRVLLCKDGGIQEVAPADLNSVYSDY